MFVVLAAAGSTDPGAIEGIRMLAKDWRARGWADVIPAFASAASPTVPEAVAALRRAGAERVVVASYLLFPGQFADRIAAAARDAGAAAVSAPLGATPELVDLVLARYDAAASIAWGSSQPAGVSHDRIRHAPGRPAHR